MKQTFSFIQTHLSQGRRTMLMTVIGREGSSPGKQGFKMAVASGGSFTGSIGGGVMEHRLVEQTKRLLKQQQALQPFLVFQNHNPQAKANRSGMICSGGQTIAFTPLDERDIPTVKMILEAVEQQQKGVFRLTEKGLSFVAGEALPVASQSNVVAEKEWEYAEQVGLPDCLYIFGGGHVGLALCKIFNNLDFKIHLFDNRPELDIFETNRFAHVKKIIDYGRAEKLVPEGYNVYVVIVTFAHKSDEQILRQMLGKNVQYLGMMGSAMKVKTIFENLKRKGFTEYQLEKVYAPIGISINSETAAEIAVSIAAQIIAVKNEATK
ncbi:MAG: xanthine dehydrogenase accessory factor [bacterium]|nr:MAG: xanthine dehydrogenase accessory factor [bacterium]